MSVIWFFCRADPEAPVKYVVELPEQAKPGWKGEVLEKPTLKVSCETMLSNHQLTFSPGRWLLSHPMLRTRNRRGSRAHQPLHSRRHRPRNCKGESSTSQMGTNELHPASQGAEDNAKVHPREPGRHCEGGLFRLWQDHGGCESRRDLGDGRKAEVDYQAWRGEFEKREEGYELLDDVQVERSHLGASWCCGSLCELEVSISPTLMMCAMLTML